jgi:hypothetical protein
MRALIGAVDAEPTSFCVECVAESYPALSKAELKQT